MDILVYDAFTSVPGKGNPAGVVIDAADFSDVEMQEAAAKLGYNESAFVQPSETADFKLRYFTPGHEVPMCGHATMASVCALYDRGLISRGHVLIETGAGNLDIEVSCDGEVKIGMTQSVYQDVPFTGDAARLAQILGLEKNMLDDRYPICYASTGLWTLLVPVKKLDYFRLMKPLTAEFPSVLTQNSRASIHPFCLETYHGECDMHGRHFSSPYSGTVEDAVTGTASGAMGAYCRKYIRSCSDGILRLKIEQGMEIGKDGIVEAEVKDDPGLPVKIFGTAVYTKTVALE